MGGLLPSPLSARTNMVDGSMNSDIDLEITHRFQTPHAVGHLRMRFVAPPNYASITYSQKLNSYSLVFDPIAHSQRTFVNEDGNKVIEASWSTPQKSVTAVVKMNLTNQVLFNHIQSTAAFPPSGISRELESYLQPTDTIQSGNLAMIQKSAELAKGSQSQIEAVTRILGFVVDHMRYKLYPEHYDALYSLRTGLGNCQNFSHLSAALLRAAGIPARVVTGITLSTPFKVKAKYGYDSLRWAEGRHAWLEIFYPDLGWVQYDAQQTHHFVSNRFIRLEVGRDTDAAGEDGMVKWTYVGTDENEGSRKEDLNYQLKSDRTTIEIRKDFNYPNKTVFAPEFSITALPKVEPVVPPPPPPSPKPPTPSPPKAEDKFIRPVRFGNMDFPENVDLFETATPKKTSGSNEFTSVRNYVVETAEFVTGREQFIQAFNVREPILLKDISLALYKFAGEDGALWVDLYDEKGGRPGKVLESSEMKFMNEIQTPRGYRWVGFDFGGEQKILVPGRYWFSLSFSGDPVVNWFFTYGKPVGDADGTWSKTLFEEDWTTMWSHEFNYRIEGMAKP